MANSSEKSASSAAEHQHQRCFGDCPHAVASTIMQRHRDNRQRFDSADYEMAQRSSGDCAGCTCGHCTPQDLEQEPEPGNKSEERQQLRCLRLQRFDSADWALQEQRARLAPESDDVPAADEPNVAQRLMERHAVKTCSYVGSAPVNSSSSEA